MDCVGNGVPVHYVDVNADKEGELIAEVLSHYRELVMLATERVPANAALDAAAVNSMAMEVETRALVWRRHKSCIHSFIVQRFRRSTSLISSH